MRTVGIVLLVLGALCLLDLILTLTLGTSNRESGEVAIGFLGNTWAPILASFFLPGGAALLLVDRKKRKDKEMIRH